MALALAPVTLLLFQKASLVSPLANFVAVPWVSLVVVPLVLLGSLFLVIAPLAGQLLLELANSCLELIWPLLQWCAALPASQIYHAFAADWVVIPATIGVVWLLAPRGWPVRWLGGVWLALAFLLPQPRPAPGEAWFTLLDVGQGLAAVVETENHLLLFDTGPRFSDTFDTGEAVVLPYLLQRGVARVDMLLISHGDNDHIGGAESLLAFFPVARLLTSVPEKLASHHPEPCRAGQRWQWDGVEFVVLNPTDELARKENNNSCVLKVKTAAGSLLLTGDIEKQAERLLIERDAAELRADILVVPHHGSKSSSTTEFIAAVAPRWALFPAGYQNRFKLPRPEVVARYRERNIELLESGRSGAITLRLGREAISMPDRFREAGSHYWNHRL
jgi:competence protein ComEC